MLDELDRRLLSELQSEGFQKSTALSSRLGVGARTIRGRMHAMRSKGMVKIVAVPNPMRSRNGAWAKIGIKVQPGAVLHVAGELVEHPSIYFVAYSLGMFDIMIAVHFDTMGELAHFVNSELTRVKGILGTETMILICPRKYYNFSWPEPVLKDRGGECRPNYGITMANSTYEMNDTDRGILSALMEDALTPARILKSRLGVGEFTIRKHVQAMLKQGVFKVEVVPNPELLEYEAWATIGITINHQFTHKVIDAIAKNPAVYLVSVSLGRFNIVLSGRFHNIDLLNQFVNFELARIKGITAIETFLHTKPLKYHSIKW